MVRVHVCVSGCVPCALLSVDAPPLPEVLTASALQGGVREAPLGLAFPSAPAASGHPGSGRPPVPAPGRGTLLGAFQGERARAGTGDPSSSSFLQVLPILPVRPPGPHCQGRPPPQLGHSRFSRGVGLWASSTSHCAGSGHSPRPGGAREAQARTRRRLARWPRHLQGTLTSAHCAPGALPGNAGPQPPPLPHLAEQVQAAHRVRQHLLPRVHPPAPTHSPSGPALHLPPTRAHLLPRHLEEGEVAR